MFRHGLRVHCKVSLAASSIHSGESDLHKSLTFPLCTFASSLFFSVCLSLFHGLDFSLYMLVWLNELSEWRKKCVFLTGMHVSICLCLCRVFPSFFSQEKYFFQLSFTRERSERGSQKQAAAAVVRLAPPPDHRNASRVFRLELWSRWRWWVWRRWEPIEYGNSLCIKCNQKGIQSWNTYNLI